MTRLRLFAGSAVIALATTFGGETQFGDGFEAEYSISWAKSSEFENGSVDPAVFKGEFEDSGLGVGFDYSDPRRPAFNVTGNTADFFDPSFYQLDEVELTVLSDAEDEEFALKYNLGYDIITDSGVFRIQGGIKGRFREKSFNGQIEFYERDDYFVSDVLDAGPSNTLADLNPLPGLTQATDFFNSNLSTFELVRWDEVLSAFEAETTP